ncbi:hypothetical protein, conserved [Trypanosoma brucei brucei TREU927]|uniref:Uncharacterized protein n=1 Tax=Trypanosoma brucei brucei (strain 927/4 GUTat10.1) TaxID=185431 RepID=Q384J2_TRYB2|nr:hypothetical protein, conserved [Trypanosoma brucei brucei TREU927]EAN79789.1 hypothetical protein, conserved [Trypanosoma brucei brucei TREU927]
MFRRAYHTNLGNAHLYHPLHQPKFHRKDTNLRVQRKQGHTAHMTSPHLLTFSQEAVCVAEEFGVAFYAPKNLKKFQVERFNGVRIAGIYATKASDGGSHLHVVDVEANWFLVSLSRVEVVSSSSIELSEENSVKQSESSRHSEECARRLPNTEGILEAHFHEAGGVLHCVVLTRWGAYETVLTNTSRIVARNIISFPFEMRNCFMSVGRTSGLVVVCQRSEKWLRYSLFEQRDNERIRMFDSPVNVQSFAVNPISNSVVLGGTRGEMVLYPSITEKNYFSDHWHHTPLTALSFSIDGKAFYSGAREGMILVWNTSSYTYKKVSCGLGCINSIAVPTGNGSRVLLSCAESTIAVLDLLQMQVEKFVEGVQWSTDESCSGLVVSQWMGQPAVILTGLPNVVRVCDPFTQQAIYSLHISSQMETIPSPPRHGIQYVGLLNNNRTIVTYEEFSGVSLPSLLRFWAYSSDSKRHEESMTICSPHRSQVLALTTDDTQQRVFTLSGEAMKCWVECKEDLNDAHAIGKKTWGNQSSCVTPSRLVQDLIISHDGSLCFISDDNVHVYNVKALHPGQPWQRVLTLTQHFSLSPLKNLTLLHECRALVATDAERVYFWSLAKPRRQATIWKDKGVGGKAAGITAMCGFSVNSVLVATERCNLWELSAADVNEMGKVVGQANSATEHRITFMKPLSLLKQPDRIAVVDSVSGFRVMHVSLEGKGGVNVQQFERTTARDESNETLSSLKQYFQEAPVRSNNFDGADENASTILDRASQVAEAQKWLVGVLADSAYTAPPMSALLSSYLQRRAGVATF